MLTLYGSAQTRTFRVLWALEEAGLSYDYKQVRLGRTTNNGTKNDAYKTINMQGKVPTLVDDGFVINESAAIVNYVAQLAPDTNLIPQHDLKQRAHYDEICFFVLSELEQPLWTTTKHRLVLPKEYRIANTRGSAEWEFAKAISVLQHYINGKQYVIDDQFTMADILVAHTLRWAHAYDFYLPEDIVTYRDNLLLRPAYQRALAKEGS